MLKTQDAPPVSGHVFPDLKNLITVLFLHTTGITLEHTCILASAFVVKTIYLSPLLPVIPSTSHLADNCYDLSSRYCDSPKYWYKGFLSLQASIDAAIIEVVANHSVWEEMKSIAGVHMKSRIVIPSITLDYSYFMITIAMCFSPFMYFLSMNVVREKKQLKVLMKTMGLRDIAFWLSWSLLYALYVLVLSCLLAALVVKECFYFSSFPAVLLLLFLYGLACIHLVFMLCSLLRTSKLAGFMAFLITLLFGCLSLVVLTENLPEPLKWFLGLFCPFAFNAGIAKVFHLEKYGMGFSFSNLMENSYFLFSTYIMLVFDSVLYMLLAMYFDKVLPGKYSIPDPPFFCLKPLYWVRSRRGSTRELPRTPVSPEELLSDNVEPVEELLFIQKSFLPKLDVVFILGLSLNIYEGQITALLGHSGAGKTTLLNVLSGLTFPSEGSATIYNYKLSEIGDREEIQELIGVCPQFNVQFGALTVKENLKTFAEIKGIRSKEVEQEVQTIMELLDIRSIQDTQAEKLSGGQKRKLSIGIAMLGNPQVLLLDEPTAGLDPLSRHKVWSLLKEHRAGRVILFSTQFMDEADILADRKAFISHGRLKCVGSSLFLKKKWGICYHLRIHVSESCDLKNVTSLVKRYIPNVIFSGHSQYELRYKLPLENMNKFPDLFSGLDSCSDQGIISYGVSMTTLEDVFLRLEEEATVDQEGTIVAANTQPAAKGNDEHVLGEQCPGSLLLSDSGKASVVSLALWRQQVSAMAWVHFLKLKSSVKNLRSILLLYVVFLLPAVLQLSLAAAWQSMSAWELSSARYFLPRGKRAWSETATSLLVYNNTGEGNKPFLILFYAGPRVFIFFSCSFKSYRFTVLCHMETVNCFPVLVNVISNALLKAFNSTVYIRIWSHPFSSDPQFWDYFVSFYLFYMLLLFSGFPPHFAMGYMQDYKVNGARTQLRVSGLFPSAYWCGQALVDIPLCWLILFSMFGLQFALNTKTSWHIMAFLSYGISIVLFTYVISFVFRGGWNCDFWSFIMIAVECKALNVATSLFQPFIHSVIFIFLLRYLEIKHGGAVLRKDPIFRISPRRQSSHQHPEELEEEDEDVKAERAAVRNAIATPSQDEKLYAFIPGEVLGLLGPNGAGKSTAMKMIAGETTLTAGQGNGATSRLQGHAPSFLGYCPQEDPLWPDLTVHQHLQVYAAVKGVSKEHTAAAVNRIVNALQLQGYLKNKTRKLSAGITRKLCFAVCMLGNPEVLLLDEPSTGMDPKGQRCVWKMLRAALKTKETGAILSTHYMEEAEAVCDRVAILVSGQIRCIGSVPYLKNKFGKGYLLEIKVKDPEHADLLHAEIMRIFPSAARQERFCTMMGISVGKLLLPDSTHPSQEHSTSCSFQVFLELSREQEKDDFDLTLDGAFEWKQLQQEDC
uniref:ABC transporter domain-containing protein n=1 Tax=Amazona collaria TaxID=241587 RepID=A0A8B9FUL4_9PSIT